MTPTSSSEGLKSMERTVDRQEIAVWRSRNDEKRVQFPRHHQTIPAGFNANAATISTTILAIHQFRHSYFLPRTDLESVVKSDLALLWNASKLSETPRMRGEGHKPTHSRQIRKRLNNRSSEATSSLPQQFARRSSPVSFLLSSPGSSWLPSASLRRRWP